MPEAGYVCVPLTARGEALGVLHLAGPRRRPGQGSLPGPDAGATLIQTIADHLGLALANLRLWETLRTQSIRDPLTGLYNRRYAVHGGLFGAGDPTRGSEPRDVGVRHV